MLEDDPENTDINLSTMDKVTGEQFNRIKEFLNLNKQTKYLMIPRPIETANLHLITSPAYFQFINAMD